MKEKRMNVKGKSEFVNAGVSAVVVCGEYSHSPEALFWINPSKNPKLVAAVFRRVGDFEIKTNNGYHEKNEDTEERNRKGRQKKTSSLGLIQPT